MSNQIKFRTTVEKDRIDERARERGYLTRAEYLRALILEDLQRVEGRANGEEEE
jgi:metal-responsive CopG/Arc/MetJ family transcriptional regulator